MPPVRRSLLLVVILSGCRTLQDPPPPTNAAGDTWGERILLEAGAIPGAWLERDRDGGARSQDIDGSSGFAARIATGNREQSVGVLYQRFYSDGNELGVDAASIDFDTRTPLDPDGPGLFFLRAGGALGGAWLEEPGDDPGTQLAAQLRIGVDFQPTPWLQVGTSLGGIVLGHPGETEAYGTFVTVGVALVF